MLKICGMHRLNKYVLHCAQHCSDAVESMIEVKNRIWYLILSLSTV